MDLSITAVRTVFEITSTISSFSHHSTFIIYTIVNEHEVLLQLVITIFIFDRVFDIDTITIGNQLNAM